MLSIEVITEYDCLAEEDGQFITAFQETLNNKILLQCQCVQKVLLSMLSVSMSIS